jgi:hypothetical protein
VKRRYAEPPQHHQGDAVYLASATPLERFIIRNEIKLVHLAAASGYSRHHLLAIRMGEREPTRRCIAAILGAMRFLTHRKLTVLDLFEFEDGPIDRPLGRHGNAAESR